MKRFISAFMTVILLSLFLNVTTFAQESVDSSYMINLLLDKRAEFICLENWSEVDLIDKQLESLNVEKLNAYEVNSLLDKTNSVTLPELKANLFLQSILFVRNFRHMFINR